MSMAVLTKIVVVVEVQGCMCVCSSVCLSVYLTMFVYDWLCMNLCLGSFLLRRGRGERSDPTSCPGGPAHSRGDILGGVGGGW